MGVKFCTSYYGKRRDEEYLATWRSREYAFTWEETTEGRIQLDNKELRGFYSSDALRAIK
jgi:hypothetical protein